MANAAEKGRAAPPPLPKPPGLVGHPGASSGGQRRTTPRPKKVTPKRTARVARSSSSSGSNRNNYRTNSLVKKSSGGSRRRSSGGENRSVTRTTPRTPTKPTTKVVKPVAPPKPAVPTNRDWLRSDSTYQRQLAAYAKALADYQADQGLQRGDYESNYQNTYRDIGLSKTDALRDLENDYAARGLLRSSLYNTDVGELNQQYQNQYTDLSKQRTAFLDQLTQGLTGFKNEQSVQQQNAMAEAVRRRAEKYNL